VSKPEVVATTTEEQEPVRMKYSRREMIGKPSLSNVKRIETVGLGNLKVETANGYTDT
jgi:hypothetical protein